MNSPTQPQDGTDFHTKSWVSRSPRHRAWRLTAIYAIFAATWIFCSDKALDSLGLPDQVYLQISVYKGIAFVIVTSFLLFWVMQRSFGAIEKSYNEREHAQRSERESKRLLQLTLDALRLQIAVLNAEGEIVTVNETWKKFSATGAREAPPVGGNYLEFCDRASTAWMGEAPVLAQGIRAVLAAEEPSFSREFQCQNGDGSFWFEISVTRFPADGLPRIMVVLENITDRKVAEVQLVAGQANLASAQRMARLGSWELDLSNKEDLTANSLHWSDELFRIMGYEPGEIEVTNENFFRVVHPDDRASLLELMSRAIQGKDRYAIDHRIILRDGTERFIHAQAELIRDEETGRPLKMVGLGQDITERKQAELEQTRLLAQLESERLRSHNIVATIPGVVWETWLASGDAAQQAGFVSDYITTLLGYSVEEWLATPNFWLTLVHPDDKVRAEQEGVAIFTGGVGGTTQYRWVAKDGRVFWMEGRIVVVKDESGQPVGLRGVTIDISERVKAEKALLDLRDELEQRVERRTSQLMEANAEVQSRARRQEAVAQLGQKALTGVDMDVLLQEVTEVVISTLGVEISAILEMAPDGKTLRHRAGTGWKSSPRGGDVPADATSQAGYALQHNTPTIVRDLRQETRFKPAQILLEHGIISGVTVIVAGPDRPFGTLGAHTVHSRDFTPDDVNFLRSMSNVLAAALEQRRVETEIRALNSQLEASNEQLRVENVERQMVMGALRETSLQFELAKEEAEKANHAKSEFLSRMSHELRTPLNAILGFGQILERQVTGPKAEESLGYILKGGNHLLDLINEVLDISRVEAGHLDLSLEPIAVADILAEASAMVRPLAAEHNIRLVSHVSKTDNHYILADRQRLKQVLINILANAVKYNREGGSVEVKCEPGTDGITTIAISDTGRGISAENLTKLFTPFERLEASNSSIEGTGLGLVLSRRLVEAMSGEVSVESTVGQGTTFVLKFPQTSSPDQAIASLMDEPTAEKDSPVTGQIYSVLCIEDNPSNLRLIEAIMSRRPDIHLLTAIQGSVGLDIARQHHPDLILLDSNLPDLSGKDVLIRLQNSDMTRDIPVVIVSADATANQIERLMVLGAKAYLTKPIHIGQFLRTLNQFLVAPDAA